MNTNKINSPGSRWGHILIYNPLCDQTLLFGGARERGTFLQDTWTWNGEIWQKHEGIGPAARGFAAAAFDSKRGLVILHGGRGSGHVTYSDTWGWDGQSWLQLEAESKYIADHHQLVSLADEQKIMAFGGWNGEDVSGETWMWDNGWQLMSGAAPHKRAAFGMNYDPQNKRVLLFGGLWVDGQYADLWQWQDGDWQQLGKPYDNSSLDHHAMIFDIEREQSLIFGGKNYRYQLLNKTQTTVGEQVVSLTNEGPSARHSLGLTYDSRRGHALLYGGKEYQGDEQLPLEDFWRWDGQKWERLSG